MVLGILLVWSAWPTVASALDAGSDRATDEVASAPSPTPPTSAVAVPTTVSAPTTVTVPPPSTAIVAPPPVTEPPATAPPDTMPEAPPLPTDPPVSSPPPPAVEVPAVAAASPPAVCDAAVGDVVAAMNRDRSGNGIGPLCTNARLTQIAQASADHLAQTGTFVHQDLWSVVDTTPFRAMAENLLRGPGSMTSDEMEGVWMASPGHREHILDGTYLAAGAGTARAADGRVYVVVEFGGLLR
jgi:uncharacterized protein YkwD